MSGRTRALREWFERSGANGLPLIFRTVEILKKSDVKFLQNFVCQSVQSLVAPPQQFTRISHEPVFSLIHKLVHTSSDSGMEWGRSGWRNHGISDVAAP